MGFMTFFQGLVATQTANTDDVASIWFRAAETGDTTAMRDLIVRGIDIDMRDGVGRNAMNIASQYGHTDAMTTILAARQMKYLRNMGLDPFALPADLPDADTARQSA